MTHLEKNINVENTPQNQLIIDDEDSNGAINIADNRFVMDNQMQATPSYLKSYNTHCNRELQTIIQNKISAFEKDLLEYISGKKYINEATQTDQISGNELNNESNNDSNTLLKKQIGTPENTALKTSLSMNPTDDMITEQSTAENILFDEELLLDEPIKPFESLPLLPRRKSLLTPRNILNSNTPAKSIQRSTSRRTTREVVRSIPAMISKPTIASEMKQRSKSINSVQPINPSKKPNELPLETRASRLKAEYLAKKRAAEANADKSRMTGIRGTTSVLANHSLTMPRKTSFTSIRSAKFYNIRESNSLNVNNQLSTFGKNILPPSEETPRNTNRRRGKKKSIRKLS
ncbi:unnamed protein product [Onchocerca flexuosa]|uniref:Inner centromere protein ARK-binding domain-containing protein n=1 Tax=Onchocerca flexuosa TaxID=387005 RepID=A0A183H0V0_9BILA|nr:unnamed protein product [Onchocerca flexuosa]